MVSSKQLCTWGPNFVTSKFRRIWRCCSSVSVHGSSVTRDFRHRSRCRNARDCSQRDFFLIFCFLLQFRSHLAGRRGSEGRSSVAVRTNFSEIVSWPTEANREASRDPGGGPLCCFVYKTIHLPWRRPRRPCCARIRTV